MFHDVLDACTVLAGHKLRLPVPATPHEIEENPKLFPYFRKVLGALDGSHFDVRPPSDGAKPFRNRKGAYTTNVLVVCDLSGRLLFVLPGWEGSANDMKVFNNALVQKPSGFGIPQGWYYLADAGYSCSSRLLVPYRGVRYHLQESARAGLRPATPEELYNLRHSQTRIIVEKAIGRLKGTFRIHRCAPSLSVETQVEVIVATAAIMNWLLEYDDVVDRWDDEVTRKTVTLEEVMAQEKARSVPFTDAERNGGATGYMAQYRQGIARRMWRDYCEELRRRGEL